MKSLVCAVSVMSLLVLVGVVSRSSGAAADEPAKIDKIMKALHKGGKSPLATLKTQLKTQSPEWSTVQKEAKTYVKYAVDLPKNEPPRGDSASWKKLSTAFATNAKALNSAVEKKDLTATKSAFHKLATSCKSCHDAHRED
ncbi:MAG: cytochrome c [Isosphaeraceae bacterium]